MSTVVDTKINTPTHKKPSKRQRKSAKNKLEKKSKKVKDKRSKRTKKIKKKDAKSSEPGVGAQATDISKETHKSKKGASLSESGKIPKGADLDEKSKKRKIADAGSSKSNVKRRKKSGNSNDNIASKSQTKEPGKTSSDINSNSSDVLNNIEPDKNWKELSKKLGIKKKKTTEVKPVDSEPADDSRKEELWFDDVEDIFIEKPVQDDESSKEKIDISAKLVKPGTKPVLTKCLAMDCEMVGVGPTGAESVLARISVVNQYGHCVYDKFVKAKEEVTDYRTWVSGVRPEDLENAEELETVQKEVNEMFKGRILVGHAIGNDEKVLFLNHSKRYIRDTQKYPPFRYLVGGRKPSLKFLTWKVLGVQIQSGEHSSVQDAQATMRLYTMVRDKWEKRIKEKYRLNKHQREKLTKKQVKKAKSQGS